MLSDFTTIEGRSTAYWGLLGALGFLVFLGLASFLYIEVQGHGVTNMNQQVVWGLPHVFAISLLVMASGALNLASMSTVFGAYHYKQFGRFSAFLAIVLLIGGLMVLLLDLGRPDRMLLTMIHMNFNSMFTWNVFLYSGFIILCFLYLWAMFQHDRFVKTSGSAAFAWRLILTTGTGSIFGVIHAREVFYSGITAPSFIAISLSSGTAACIVLLLLTYRNTNRPWDPRLMHGMRNMLVFFTLLVGYLLVVEKFTKNYSPAHYDVEAWILTGSLAWLYWGGVVVAGVLLPLFLTMNPATSQNEKAVLVASVSSIVGLFAFVGHTLIAGQTYPLNIFPGYQVESIFLDGQMAEYLPSLVELLLGLGGIATALLLYLLGIRFFRLLPAKAKAPEGWVPWNP